MQVDPLLELNQAIQKILDSPKRHKLVVAGPGAGKTSLFKRLLEGRSGTKRDHLVLTFINELKDDLERNLSDFAYVYTFHGYCHYLLRNNSAIRAGLTDSFSYFPPLASLIKSDWEVVYSPPAPQFVGLMRTLSRGKELNFYKLRSEYYDAVGYDDSVYRVHEQLKVNPDLGSTYELLLIDEYQDFNAMESSFISLLSEKSNTVIAGDDDQALYSQLRGSSQEFIRALHSQGEFEVFELPFCMRCPKSIVDAVNQVILCAEKEGCLQGRISKPFRHFEPAKGKDSRKYPYIQQVECSTQSKPANYFGKYIAEAIRNISPDEIIESRDKLFPTVLVIGQIQYLRQIRESLLEEGFVINEKQDVESKLDREAGLSLLKFQPESNLGWRIIMELDKPSFAKKVISESITSLKPLGQLLPTDFRVKTLQEADALIIPTQSDRVPEEIPDNDQAIIKLTSYEGSKGLSAQHVFVVGVHEGELPRDSSNIQDLEICKFVVSLTRTRKQCYILTAHRFSGKPKRQSLFLSWIPSAVKKISKVNKQYWLR